MTVVSVYAIFANAEEAERIGRQMVEERLAACINILGPCRSIYRWQGAVETRRRSPRDPQDDQRPGRRARRPHRRAAQLRRCRASPSGRSTNCSPATPTGSRPAQRTIARGRRDRGDRVARSVRATAVTDRPPGSADAAERPPVGRIRRRRTGTIVDAGSEPQANCGTARRRPAVARSTRSPGGSPWSTEALATDRAPGLDRARRSGTSRRRCSEATRLRQALRPLHRPRAPWTVACRARCRSNR